MRVIIQSFSSRRGLAGCQLGPLVFSASGAKYRRVCHNKWACPSCSPYLLGRDRERIASALQRAEGVGYLTLSISHSAGAPPARSLDALVTTWTSAFSTGSWMSDYRSRTGMTGWARTVEFGWALVLPASGIDTTAAAGPGAKFSAQIQAAASELERGLISVRTREGMAQRKSEGATFGREVAPEFLPTYRRVLEMHADGEGLNAIARTLNAEGVPTAKGGTWYASTVRAIVTSETAKGLVK